MGTWASWAQAERDRERGRAMAQRVQQRELQRVLAELDAGAAEVHARDMRPRLASPAQRGAGLLPAALVVEGSP
jgi:hypothetical protein